MKYEIEFEPYFIKKAKSIRKRNPRFRDDLAEFFKTFEPQAHPVIPGTGGAQKARMKALGRGKSGSYRIIYYFHIEETVYLLTIYDKVRQVDLTTRELAQITQFIAAIKRDQI